MARTRHLFNGLLFCLILGPIGVLSYFIKVSSVNVPHWEEWSIVVSMFQQISEGIRPSFHMLYTDTQAHVIVVPKAIIFLIGSATALNFSVMHLFNLLFCLATFAILASSVLADRSLSLTLKLILLSTISVLEFSLEPVAVYLWGLSLYIFVTLFLAVVSAMFISRPTITKKGLLVLLCSNAAALLTSINSIGLVFLVFFVAVFKALRERRSAWWIVALGSALELAVIIVVLLMRTAGNSVNLLAHGSAEFLKFVFVYLGSNSELNDVASANLYGILYFSTFAAFVLMLLILLVKPGAKKLAPTAQFFLFLGLFALSSAFLTAIGREGESGARQALTDRYIPFAHLFAVALAYFSLYFSSLSDEVNLPRSSTPPLRYRRIIRTSATCIFIVLSLDSTLKSFNHKNIETFKRFQTERISARTALLHAPNLSEADEAAMTLNYPGGYGPVDKWNLFMKREHLGPFK